MQNTNKITHNQNNNSKHFQTDTSRQNSGQVKTQPARVPARADIDKRYEMNYKLTKIISVIILLVNVSSVIDYTDDITNIFEICTKYKTDSNFSINNFIQIFEKVKQKIKNNPDLENSLKPTLHQQDTSVKQNLFNTVWNGFTSVVGMLYDNKQSEILTGNATTDDSKSTTQNKPPIDELQISVLSVTTYAINELVKNKTNTIFITNCLDETETTFLKTYNALFSLNAIERIRCIYQNATAEYVTPYFKNTYYNLLNKTQPPNDNTCGKLDDEYQPTCKEKIDSFCLIHKKDFYKVIFIICQVLQILLVCFLPERHGYIARLFCCFQTWVNYMTQDDKVFFTHMRLVYLLFILGVFEYIFLLKKKE